MSASSRCLHSVVETLTRSATWQRHFSYFRFSPHIFTDWRTFERNSATKKLCFFHSIERNCEHKKKKLNAQKSEGSEHEKMTWQHSKLVNSIKKVRKNWNAKAHLRYAPWSNFAFRLSRFRRRLGHFIFFLRDSIEWKIFSFEKVKWCVDRTTAQTWATKNLAQPKKLEWLLHARTQSKNKQVSEWESMSSTLNETEMSMCVFF